MSASQDEAFRKGELAAKATALLEATTVQEFLSRLQFTGKESLLREPDPSSPKKHTETVKRRSGRSYVSPSRENTVSLIAHVEPELANSIKHIAKETGLGLNEFLTAVLQRVVYEHDPAHVEDIRPTEHLSEEALAKTRELQQTLERLTVNLVSRTR